MMWYIYSQTINDILYLLHISFKFNIWVQNFNILINIHLKNVIY